MRRRSRPASAGDSEAFMREETLRRDFRILQNAGDIEGSQSPVLEIAEAVPVVSPAEDYSPVSG